MKQGPAWSHQPPDLGEVPRRIVSLVPSITESLFDLGLGEAVVGITDFCVHPRSSLERLPRLGGPKNPRVPEILALQPDLVLANWEENSRQSLAALERAGMRVWVSFPCTVRQALDFLRALADLFQARVAYLKVQSLEVAVEYAEAAAASRPASTYFCPIWQDQLADGTVWWMAFNGRTYASDLMRLMGGQNLCESRERRYPLMADLGYAEPEDPADRDTRYPRLSEQELRTLQPDVIVLPDEPFAFHDAHRERLLQILADSPAARNGRVCQVDGSLITWHGTRLAHALAELPTLFDPAG